MGNLLQSGSGWLEQMRTAHCSSPILYRRGEVTVSTVASYGKTEYELVDESGFSVGAHAWDFLILVADLGLEPRPGDRIIAEGQAHEVTGLGGGGCWRYSDPFRQTYRIHTKHLGAAE